MLLTVSPCRVQTLSQESAALACERESEMSLHVIVGAGPVGTATATLLADRGEQVRVVTRRGTGPERPEVERIAADATDADRLAELCEGAVALYNCASPQYHQWF